MNYKIYIKYENDTGGYLTHRNRTEWKLRTARKHLRDVIRGIQSGKYVGARYAALVAS